jgi:hypothetical protein
MHVEGDEHYPIIPPMQCMSVQIANTTERDLRVEADSQGVEYFVLSAGDERLIQLTQPGAIFRPGQINFYLSPEGSGTVILLWA